MNKETVEQAGKRLGFSKPNYVEFDGHQNEGFYFDIFKKGWDVATEQSVTEAIEFAEWIKENQFYEAKGMWMRKNALTGENEGRYNWTSLTSKQLYELYKQSIL